MAQDIKKRLYKAHQLIKEKRFQEAYDYLEDIDHPKARDWQHKIEQLWDVEKEKPKNSDEADIPEFKPWNPRNFVALTLFGLVAVIASFILSLNWKRLGRPEWVVPSLLITVGIPITAFILLISLALGQTIDMTSPISMGVIIGPVVALIYMLPGTIISMQTTVYEKWEKQGNLAVLEHDYRIERKAMWIALATVALSVGIAGYTYYLSIPLEFESDFISFEYQKSWDIEDPAEFEICTPEWRRCELILSEAQFAYTAMAIKRVTLDYSMTAQDIATDDLDHYRTLGNFEYGGQDTLVIDNHEAVVSYLNYDFEGERLVHHEFYAVHGDYLLQITAWSNCAGCLREDMPKIMKVIDSIKFVN